MKQILLLSGILCLLLCNSYAQTNGYIVKGDTAYIQGRVSVNYSDPAEIIFSLNKEHTETYTADQLSEFGFMDGRKFLSRKVTIDGEQKYVFLELIEEGEADLLLLTGGGNRFYIEDKDSVLHSLEKDAYHAVLQRYTAECSKWAQQHKLVKYRRQALYDFVHRYNSKKCRQLPFSSFGPVARYSKSGMSVNDDAFAPKRFGKYKMMSEDLQFGFFMETPVWSVNNTGFMTEILYGRSAYMKELMSASVNQDISIEMAYLSLHAAPKYTFHINKHRLYGFLGGNLTYMLESSSAVFQADIAGDVIRLESYPSHIKLPEYNVAVNYGAGFQFFIRYDHYIALEIGSARFLNNEKGVSLTNNLLSIKANL
ncbi:hypothetical protein [Cesiribacter sp. SM1]|uniref:hypothetical protein n=1 Tax=Cesiribacter sp. SM1 TaxID=2861196 RepID=UPI001CD244C8|nr:hypothetical protein [Cesiribacter sp. SM1]